MYKRNVKSALDSLSQSLVSLGANPYRIDLPRPPGMLKMGVDDFLVLNKKKAKKAFEELNQISLFLADGITGDALLRSKFKEPRWIIPGLIATGLTVFAGKPKIGKSWLVLSLICSISSGKDALGRYTITESGEAAYLALEDSEVRLQNRLRKLGAQAEDINNAHFFCKWNRVEEGGLIALESWLAKHPRCRIVFIDTFAKVRSTPKNNNSYYEDYQAASALKAIADTFNVAIVVVHHLRKQGADDPFDAISGTNGIAGSADTNIVLMRDGRNADGVLYVTGRDVDEQELAMSFDDCIWKVVGDAAQVHATKTQSEILILLHETGEAMTPTQIAHETGRKTGGLSKTLRKMMKDGLLDQVERGKYVPKAPAIEKNHKLRGKAK